jgi:hypothetical protein
MPKPTHEHALARAVPLLYSLERLWRPATDARRRFLTPAMASVLALYALVTVSLGSYSVNNDSLVYLDFMRRLTGESTTAPSTHQFGSALFTLPFFLFARVLHAAGLRSIGGAPLEQVSMVVATAVAFTLLVYLGWRLLRDLELPARPIVIVLAVVGTPLFFYAALQPTYKHTIDALLVTLEAFLLLVCVRRPSPGALLALGACLGFSITIRSANLALVPGMVLPFLLRRELRRAGLVFAAAAVVAAALFGTMKAAGVSGGQVAMPPVARVAASPVLAANTNFFWCRNYTWHLTFAQCLRNKLGINPDPAAPVKMLFTLHRGLFLWTPLTALAAIGFVLLVRRRRDERPYLIGLGVAAVSLVLVHMLWGDFWDDGFSFSQRFLAALFPVFLLGTAELVRRGRVLAIGALGACALFSLGLAFTFFIGYKGISSKDGVDRMVRLYTSGERTPQQLVRRLGVDARGRWLGH